MLTIDEVEVLPFLAGVPRPALAKIAAAASMVEYEANALLTRQHDRAIALFLLLSGNVQFLIEVEGRGKLLLGVGHGPDLIIGWSVFKPPFRYIADVRCQGPCRLLRIPHHVVDELLETDPASGLKLIRRVTESLAMDVERERARLLRSGPAGPVDAPPSEAFLAPAPTWSAESLQTRDNLAGFLAESALLEGVAPNLIQELTGQARVLGFDKGARIFGQGDAAEHLYLLIDGRVGFVYCEQDGNQCMFLQALENTGDALGWSALVEPRRYHSAATALTDTHLVALHRAALEQLMAREPSTAILLVRRVLQSISSRLHATRVRLVSRYYGDQVRAIRTILEESAESLPVTSALHKIPHLLEHRLTLADAFHALELTRAHGDPTERNLAELALEILQDVHRELDLYQDLQNAYEVVANAPAEIAPEQARRLSMEAFRELFGKLSYRIRGTENLPEHGGNIFIMNHLENHMETMLPNEFRLTLDSHFVASMVLYPHYGEAPVRVVHKPEPGWFGYQQYFDRLDYLYVYPGDVDEEDRDLGLTRQTRNQRFQQQAAAHLRAGRNLMIAPEGKCSHTEDSPGPFKAGAFRLAASLDPEPLIVPVAVANFDKRLTRSTTAAVVMPPFRLSESVNGEGDGPLFDFVNALQERYRDYVRQAIELAAS